jgi:hypothetical protein
MGWGNALSQGAGRLVGGRAWRVQTGHECWLERSETKPTAAGWASCRLLRHVSSQWPVDPAPSENLGGLDSSQSPRDLDRIEHRIGRTATRLHDSCDGGILGEHQPLLRRDIAQYVSPALLFSGRRRPFGGSEWQPCWLHVLESISQICAEGAEQVTSAQRVLDSHVGPVSSQPPRQRRRLCLAPWLTGDASLASGRLRRWLGCGGEEERPKLEVPDEREGVPEERGGSNLEPSVQVPASSALPTKAGNIFSPKVPRSRP